MTFLYFMVRGNQLLRRQSGHGHGGRSLALSVPREGFRRGQSLVVGGGEGRGLPSSQCLGRPWSEGRSMWGCSEQRVWLISTWSRAPDHE